MVGEIRYCDTSHRAFIMLFSEEEKLFEYAHGIVTSEDPTKILAELKFSRMRSSKVIDAEQLFKTAMERNSNLRCLKKFK